MLEPNAVFDIAKHMNGKLSLIRNYPSQLRTVDYLGYTSCLATRARLPRRIAAVAFGRSRSVRGVAKP
jgi:hypothetical protein